MARRQKKAVNLYRISAVAFVMIDKAINHSTIQHFITRLITLL